MHLWILRSESCTPISAGTEVWLEWLKYDLNDWNTADVTYAHTMLEVDGYLAYVGKIHQVHNQMGVYITYIKSGYSIS